MSCEMKLAQFGKFLDNLRLGRRIRFYVKIYMRKARFGRSPWSVLTCDLLLATFAFLVSIHLRLGFDLSDFPSSVIISNLAAFALTFASVWLWMRIQAVPLAMFSSIYDYIRICIATLVVHIIYIPLLMLMNREEFLPYSVLFINFCVLCTFLLILRFIIAFRAARRELHTIFIGDLRPLAEIYCDCVAAGQNCAYILDNETFGANFEFPVLGRLADIERIFRALRSSGRLPYQVICSEPIPYVLDICSKYSVLCFQAL